MQSTITAIGEFLATGGYWVLIVGVIIAIAYGWRALCRTETYLRWRVRFNPLSVQAHLDLGDHLSDDQPEEAEAEIKQAIALNPELIDPYYSLVRLQLHHDSKPGEAEQTARRMLQLFPDDTIAHAYRGLLFESQQLYAEAERAFRKAINSAPELAWPYRCLGDLLGKKTQNYLGAELAYTQAVRNDPTDWVNYFELGNVLAQNKRYPEAINCLQVAIEKNPKLARLHISLAFLHMATDCPSEAERAVRRALKSCRVSAVDEVSVSALFRQMGRLSEAEGALRRAIKKDPDLIAAYNDLGLLLNRKFDRNTEAEAIYRQGLSIEPANQDLNYNLALVLRQTAREEEAIPLLQQTLATDPSDYEAYLGLASIERLCGNQELCLEYADKARALISCDDFYDLACLESVCGNTETAFEHLERATGQSEIDIQWAWKDPDLQFIRADARFAEIIGPQPSSTPENVK